MTVQRTGGNKGAATVNYATGDRTATAGTDYLAASGTLVFAAGEVEKTFTVQTRSDGIAEASEIVDLHLSGASGAVVDWPPALPAFFTDVDVLPGSGAHGQIIIREPEPPNDTLAVAPLVALTPPVTRLSANLAAPAGDSTDVFAFTNTVAGARLWALAVPSGPPVWREFSSDPVLGVYAPGGGTPLQQDDQDGFVTGPAGQFPGGSIIAGPGSNAPWAGLAAAIAGQTLTMAGRHCLAVSVMDGVFPRAEVSSPVRLEAVDPLEVFVTLTTGPNLPESEPNDTPASACPLLTLTRDVAVRTGNLGGTDVDCHSVELAAGDLLFVSMDEKPGAGAALDASIELLAPGGAELVTAASSSPGQDPRPAESFVWTAQASGTYHLQVRPTSPGQPAGDYLLMAARHSPSGPLVSGVQFPGSGVAGTALTLSANVAGADPADVLVVRVSWGGRNDSAVGDPRPRRDSVQHPAYIHLRLDGFPGRVRGSQRDPRRRDGDGDGDSHLHRHGLKSCCMVAGG